MSRRDPAVSFFEIYNFDEKLLPQCKTNQLALLDIPIFDKLYTLRRRTRLRHSFQ